MKKLIALCIVTTLVSSVTGCGCFRRVRDFLCRGSRCGTAAVIAAPPMVAAPPMMAPMAYDPGCGCDYGQQTYGYAPSYDSGWMPGAAGCDSCSGGYSMPAYDGGYSGGGYLPGPGGQIDPGPASGGG